MALTKYSVRRPSPSLWSDLESNRLSRIFDDAFFAPVRSSGWSPAISVTENAESLDLTAELPGLSEDDVSIEVENNVLTISGEKSETRSSEDEELKYHVVERSYGSFRRAFTLPRTVDASKISARFDSGILHVTLPKAPESKGRRIEIQK